MKLCVIDHGTGEGRVAIVTAPDRGRLLPANLTDVVDVIRAGLTASDLWDLAEAAETPFQPEDLAIPVRQFTKNILCTGWNYHAHFEEGIGRRDSDISEMPAAPTFFTKAPSALARPSGALLIDQRLSPSWDYEAEIAVIIGSGGRSIPQPRAAEHIFGYCLANDISQRSLQRRHGGQWFRGKTVDDTTPLGPWITLADAVNLDDVTLECVVNGEVRQSASARQMAFPLARVIAELSLGMTLQPGDIILTGTPAGVGMAMDPPLWLQPGDVVETSSNLLGKMRHVMTATDLFGDSDLTL